MGGEKDGSLILVKSLIPFGIHKVLLVEFPCHLARCHYFAGNHAAVVLGCGHVARESVEALGCLHRETVGDGGIVVPAKEGSLGLAACSNQIGPHHTILDRDGRSLATTRYTAFRPTGTRQGAIESAIADGTRKLTGKTTQVALVAKGQGGLGIAARHLRIERHAHNGAAVCCTACITAHDGCLLDGDIAECGPVGRTEQDGVQSRDGLQATVERTFIYYICPSDRRPVDALQRNGGREACVGIGLDIRVHQRGKPQQVVCTGKLIESVRCRLLIGFIHQAAIIALTVQPVMVVLLNGARCVLINGPFIHIAIAMDPSGCIDRGMRRIGHGNRILAQVLEPHGALRGHSVHYKTSLARRKLGGFQLVYASGHRAVSVQIGTPDDGGIAWIAAEGVTFRGGSLAHIGNHHAMVDGDGARRPSADATAACGALCHNGASKAGVLHRGMAVVGHQSHDSAKSAVAYQRRIDSSFGDAVLNRTVPGLTHQSRGILGLCGHIAAHIEAAHRAGQHTEQGAILSIGGRIDGEGVVLSVEGAGVGDRGCTNLQRVVVRDVDVGRQYGIGIGFSIRHKGGKVHHVLWSGNLIDTIHLVQGLRAGTRCHQGCHEQEFV